MSNWLRDFQDGKSGAQLAEREISEVARLLADVGLDKLATRLYDADATLERSIDDMDYAVKSMLQEESQRSKTDLAETLKALIGSKEAACTTKISV